MQVEVAKHALDRVPLSLYIDDSAPLVNLNYFFIRDRNADTGATQRWEDIPVVIPEFFTREFAEWCADNGVRGKFSVVPCPAGLGRIDQGLSLFGQAQLDSWLQMCREVIHPIFSITPEMLTHTHVLDLKTLKPLESRIWEQWGWERLPEDQEAYVSEYIKLSCQILVNVGLTPEGVTSPGGLGGKNLPFYAKVANRAVREVTGNPTPFLLKRISHEPPVETPVWEADREAGTALGEIIACTGDWTGSWTGYDQVDPDKYITSDLQGGRLPAIIDDGSPCVLCSHWQGFYGMHNDDRRGFNTFKTVVRRLKERDPHSERTRWRTAHEITNYACAREMAECSVQDGTIRLDMPVQVPEFTLKIKAADIKGVRVDGRPLDEAGSRRGFASGTYYREANATFIAFDPTARRCTVEVIE